MSAEEAQDLAACAREPIHVPGSIQPHGFLVVIDPGTDRVVQAAGEVGSLVGFKGCVAGATARDILGVSLADLVRQSGTTLLHQPVYIGTMQNGQGADLTLIAHLVQGSTVVEALPAGPSASAATTLANIRSITERVGGATDVLEACSLAAAEVRGITGYDRIMVYRFLADGSGSVIAEDKDARLAPFLNHRYPESDIPQQARELYRRSAIRSIPNVNYIPAPLMPPMMTDQLLDMSCCALRSVSPVHIRYLKNMDVGASMSVSLLPRGELWGLIACHNTTAKLLSYEAQEACRHVGQILSHLIAARNDTDADRIAPKLGAARDKVLGGLAVADKPGAILSICHALQAIADCDGTAVCLGPEVVTAGYCPEEFQVRELAGRLEPHLAQQEFYVTDRLCEDDAEAAAFASHASGLLAIRLPGDDPAVLMWFRAEQVQEVMWAGNPHKPVEPGSKPGTLNPRASFATWQETVRGRSRPWAPADIDSVRAFKPAAAFLLQQQRVRQLNRLLGEANQQLAALAATDGLTGIANRRAFDERLHQEWARASRSGSQLGLVILDLDFFKRYNDHFGHPTGDECLKQIARLIQDGRRPADLAARVGGEEFALLLPDTDCDGALALAEAVRSGIEQSRIDHPKCPWGIMTASIGVACLTPHGTGTAHDLMKAADRALYEAKSQGRNRVVKLSIS
jgi:two-component system, chemotaxis family, sensor kinase Cph1